MATGRHRLSRINLLGVTTAQPLLLWIETRPKELLSARIVSWPSAALNPGWSVGSWRSETHAVYSQGTHRSAERGKAAPSVDVPSGTAIVEAILDALDDEKLTWPPTTDIKSVLVEERFYDYHSKERVRMVLAAIDQISWPAARNPSSTRSTTTSCRSSTSCPSPGRRTGQLIRRRSTRPSLPEPGSVDPDDRQPHVAHVHVEPGAVERSMVGQAPRDLASLEVAAQQRARRGPGHVERGGDTGARAGPCAVSNRHLAVRRSTPRSGRGNSRRSLTAPDTARHR